ncbi:MlaD family protein [Allohahella marinimesophila]|uniref:Mce/MlaD domain-containing protein n=1 Tax=Allohahella marinimesophila TaxID=1054972 RepID=A0ABP7NI02_9GAMM
MTAKSNAVAELRRQDRTLGLFIVVACGIALYLLLQQTYSQSQKLGWIQLESLLSNSFGVKPGTLIELSGVTIGQVGDVRLRKDARVEIDTLIDDQYAQLLKIDSKLQVSSALGLDTVLSGSSLELIPGTSDQLLDNGGSIAIVEPKSIDQIMDEMKLEELATQIQTIVANLETITSNLAAQQTEVSVALANMSAFTGELVVIAEDIPALLKSVNHTLGSFDSSLDNLDVAINSFAEPAATLMLTSDRFMMSAEQSMQALQPTLEAMPSVLSSANQTMLALNKLTTQVSNHWLLGGEGASTEDSALRHRLLSDDSLYDSRETAAAMTNGSRSDDQ